MSGVVSASLSRDPDTPDQRIVRFMPMQTTVSPLRGRPAYVPIKPRRKRGRHEPDTESDGDDDSEDDADNGDMPLPKRTRRAVPGGITERYSAGNLLLDSEALTVPGRYSTAQIKWAVSMATALLRGAIQRYTALRFRCEQISPDEYARNIRELQDMPVDLVEEPVVVGIAANGAWSFKNDSSLPAPVSACEKLSRVLDLVRTWMGTGRELERVVCELEEEGEN